MPENWVIIGNWTHSIHVIGALILKLESECQVLRAMVWFSTFYLRSGGEGPFRCDLLLLVTYGGLLHWLFPSTSMEAQKELHCVSFPYVSFIAVDICDIIMHGGIVLMSWTILWEHYVQYLFCVNTAKCNCTLRHLFLACILWPLCMLSWSE